MHVSSRAPTLMKLLDGLEENWMFLPCALSSQVGDQVAILRAEVEAFQHSRKAAGGSLTGGR